MRIMLCIIYLSLLVSCSNNSSRPEDIDFAGNMCEQNGGISQIERAFFPPGINVLEVWCLNGAKFNISDGAVYRDFTKKPLTTPKE